MAVAALGGGLFVKWQNSRGPAPVAVSAAAPIAPASTVAPLPAPAAPSSDALPSPVGDEDLTPEVRKPNPRPTVRRTRPATTTLLASSEIPPVEPPPPQPEAQPVSPPPEVTQAPETQPAPEAVAPAPPPPPAPRQVTLRAGMLVSVRTTETLSSEKNQAGDTFSGTLDRPIIADGFVIAERGSRVEGRVVSTERAGRVSGVSDLAIELIQFKTSDGQRIHIATDPFDKHGEKSAAEDAEKVGGGAGLGAIIGAIAGGGRGAGIGAAAGGAAGAGGVLLTRGKPAVLRSETRIDFRLRTPVTVTENAAAQQN